MLENVFPIQNEPSEYPSTNKLFLLLFCGYVIYWYLQGGIRFHELGKIRFEFLYAGFLSVIALVTSRINKKETCPLLPYICLFFLILIIQIPFSYDFETSWNTFIDRVVKFSFMAFFITSFVQSPRDLRYFLGAFLLACFKMGQEGLIGNLSGSMVWQNQGVMRLHGSTPIYFHPNSFAGMALGTIPFVITLWPIASKAVKAFLFVLALFAMNIIIFTGSRTGYVGFIILLFFIVFHSRGKSKTFLVMIMVVGLLIFFAPKGYQERFASIYTGQDKEGNSTGARKRIIKDAWEIFLGHPLGVGIGAFPAIRKDVYGLSQDTHNLYLEVATNLGIQGVVVFTLLLIKTFRLLKELQISFFSQREKILDYIKKEKIPDCSIQKIEQHLRDIRLMESVCRAVYLFIIVRLSLGLFGMDLYEIYWWFAFGIVISIWQMEIISRKITDEFILKEQT
ncbi:O-antigen ligase family protein [Desulfocastanea catecholica]